jgi:hypothetical protein
MKKVKFEDMHAEYNREDLGNGVRGKYFEAYQKGTNWVLLRPDVAKAFPTEEAVNDALRALINLSHKSISITSHSKPSYSKRQVKSRS